MQDMSNENTSNKFHWIDIVRTDTITISELPSLLKNCFHERHLSDINNKIHPPYYEITED